MTEPERLEQRCRGLRFKALLVPASKCVSRSEQAREDLGIVYWNCSNPSLLASLYFESGEAAQVDFGADPILEYPDGRTRRTWAFVMTQCHSRHQYVEFLWDQTVATWLGCHRRAFEWFAGVPQPVIIDNAQFTITMAYMHVHGRPRFAKLSVHDNEKVKIAPVHPDFSAVLPLSLMGFAGWFLERQIALDRALHISDLTNHGLTCLAITA